VSVISPTLAEEMDVELPGDLAPSKTKPKPNVRAKAKAD
jgi:hypothetical protein